MAEGDIYRLSTLSDYISGGDDAVNVFHFRQESPAIFASPAEDLAEAFIATVVPAYVNCMTAGYVLHRIAIKQVTGGAQEYEQAVTEPGTAGVVGSMLPTTVSGLLSWRTGLAGRSNRGRTYLPPTNEEQLSSGLWTGSYMTAMEGFAEDALALGTAVFTLHANWTIGVWSVVLSAFVPYTHAIARQIPATIRRRRIGQGS